MTKDEVLSLIATDSLPKYQGRERLAVRKANEAMKEKVKFKVEVNENAKSGAAADYENRRYTGD